MGAQHGVQLEVAHAGVESVLQVPGALLRRLRLDALLLARRLEVEQFGMARVPEVDLSQESLADLLASSFSGGDYLASYFCEVLGQGVDDRPRGGDAIGIGDLPRSGGLGGQQVADSLRRGHVVQVGGGANTDSRAVRGNLDEVEPLRHGPRGIVAVRDRLGDCDQEPGRLACVLCVDEHGAVLEHVPVGLHGQ